jgi:hypothetical protein
MDGLMDGCMHAWHTHLGVRGPSCGQLRQRAKVCSFAITEARGTRWRRLLPLVPFCCCRPVLLLLLLHLNANLHGCAAIAHTGSSASGCTSTAGGCLVSAAGGRYSAIAACLLCLFSLDASRVLHARPCCATAARLLADNALAVVAVDRAAAAICTAGTAGAGPTFNQWLYCMRLGWVQCPQANYLKVLSSAGSPILTGLAHCASAATRGRASCCAATATAAALLHQQLLLLLAVDSGERATAGPWGRCPI